MQAKLPEGVTLQSVHRWPPTQTEGSPPERLCIFFYAGIGLAWRHCCGGILITRSVAQGSILDRAKLLAALPSFVAAFASDATSGTRSMLGPAVSGMLILAQQHRCVCDTYPRLASLHGLVYCLRTPVCALARDQLSCYTHLLHSGSSWTKSSTNNHLNAGSRGSWT